jgi:tetratricopeptide (TPR) repeat protein
MDITSKIFELLGNVDSNYKNLSQANRIEILNNLDKEWELMPEEKYENEDKSMLALFLANEYISYSVFDKATKWVNILLMNRLDDPSQVGLYKGKLYFEQKNYEDSYRFFDMAFKDSKERIFKGEDPKYLQFYKDPQKYMK